MTSCDQCGSTILFGGEREGGRRYCSEECLAEGHDLVEAAEDVPDQEVHNRVQQIRHGPCPKCGSSSPVDVQTSHYIWSALAISKWNSPPEICCGSCGTKSKLGNTLFSFLFGWWAIPWGLILTPIQIGKNCFGLFTDRIPSEPSDEMKQIVRYTIVAEQSAETADRIEVDDIS